MLEKLDEITWGGLRAINGSAQWIPQAIRDLVEKPEDREIAYEGLYFGLADHGRLSEASVMALPFLVEVAAMDGVVRREEVVSLVGAILDDCVDGHFWQCTDTESCPEYRERCRAIVFENRELFFGLLNDAQPMVRASAAYVVSRLVNYRTQISAVLVESARNERDALTRAAKLWCVGAIKDDSPGALALLRGAMEGTDVRQRFAAAVAFERATKHRPMEVLTIYRCMAGAACFGEGFMNGLPWDYNPEVLLTDLLAELDADLPAARKILFQLLNEPVEPLQWVVEDLLRMDFPKANWREAPQPFSAQQRETLQALVATERIWSHPKMWMIFKRNLREHHILISELEGVKQEMHRKLE